MTRPADWPRFLAEYHAARPGITEDLLAPARDRSGRNPYAWLAHELPAVGPVLDLACGSAPLARRTGPAWLGIDRSHAELHRAHNNGASPLVAGDAGQLPFADTGIAAVVCSMALMLLTPTEEVLAEIRRVLAPGGTLHLLLPTVRPLTFRDRIRYASMYATLGMSAQLPPTAIRRRPRRTLTDHGFTVTDDIRCRFAYPVTDTIAADRFLDGLYLPGVRPDRLERGRRRVQRWIGTDIGLPLRRIIARAPQ